MFVRPADRRSKDNRRAWAIALILCGAIGLLMVNTGASWGPGMPSHDVAPRSRVLVELVPPPESEMSQPLPLTFTYRGPEKQPPAPHRPKTPPISLAPPTPTPTPFASPREEPPIRNPLHTDDEIRRALASDKERALAELSRIEREGQEAADRIIGKTREQLREEERKNPQLSDTAPDPSNADSPAKADVPRPVPIGTVRELELSGYPQAAIDTVMKRYGLRVTERMMAGGVPQSFLSSASTSDGGKFLSQNAGANGEIGIFHVFLISPKAVVAMSRMEEAELQKRSLDPLRTRVKRVKFGMTGPEQNPDLGIILFEAEPVGG